MMLTSSVLSVMHGSPNSTPGHRNIVTLSNKAHCATAQYGRSLGAAVGHRISFTHNMTTVHSATDRRITTVSGQTWPEDLARAVPPAMPSPAPRIAAGPKAASPKVRGGRMWAV